MAVTNQYVGPIFSQDWWLETVAPGQWGSVSIEDGGKTIARMPYVKTEKHNDLLLTMPPLTQTLGPWISPYYGKYASKFSREKKLFHELIDKLPRFDYFHQRFHYSVTNWLPFYWMGFQQSTRYTYVIEDIHDTDAIWRNLRKNIRGDIRKAGRQVKVRTDVDIDAFIRLNEMTYHRQGKDLSYSKELVKRIDQICEKYDCRKIFFAEDNRGRLHAAVYIVWDSRSAYYIMGGADPELRNSGATSLLLWEAIQFAAIVTQAFDFEGSMVESIERFFRAFGGKQKPFFQVTKTNALSIQMRRDIANWRDMWRAK